MMTITLDDNLVNQVVAVTHYHNAQEAVIKALSEYVQQHEKKEPNIAQLLAMPNGVDIDFKPPRASFNFSEQLRLSDDVRGDDLALLFEREKDTARNIDL